MEYFNRIFVNFTFLGERIYDMTTQQEIATRIRSQTYCSDENHYEMKYNNDTMMCTSNFWNRFSSCEVSWK